MFKKNIAAFMIAAAAAAVLAGCSSGSGTQAETEEAAEAAAETETETETEAETEEETEAESQAETKDKESITGNVSFYTADPEEIATEVLDAFIEEYPNCTYTLTRNGTGKLTAAMTAELEAGGTECNCFSFSDLAYIYGLDEQGLLMHFTPAGAENLVDTTFGDMAYSYKLESSGIAYNTTLVSEPINDWYDLTDESLKGMVAFPDPGYSGAALTCAVTHAYNPDITGWDFYQAMKDNDLKFEQSNGNLQSKVASGEYAAVVIVDYMARNAKAEGAPVEFVYPESGAIIIYSPFAIMSTVKDEDKDAVLAFADFLLSDTAQSIYAKYNYLPGVTTAEAPEGLDFNSINFLPMDMDYYMENVDSVRSTYEEMFPAS